jgi:hypothetical protein
MALERSSVSRDSRPNDRPTANRPGIRQGIHRGHDVRQVAMSDDGLPYYRCANRGCEWGRVGAWPDHLDRECDGRNGCAVCQPFPGDPCVCGWDA